MAEFPALPLWTDSYLADTRHLTTQEHGAYLLLLMEAWRRKDCALPDDDALWARLAGLDMRAWKRIKTTIRAFWSERDDGYLEQKRLVDERQYVSRRSERAVTAAKARHGARSLKLHNKVPAYALLEGVLEPCLEPTPTPTPTPIEEPPSREPPQEEAPDEPEKRSRGTRIPEDWQLTDEGREWARNRGLDEDCIEEEAGKFYDHYTAAAGARARKASWPHAWQVWVRRHPDFKPPDRHSAADRQGNSIGALRKVVTSRAAGAGQRHGSGNGAGSFDAGTPDGPRSIEGGLAGEPLADDVGGLPAGARRLPGA